MSSSELLVVFSFAEKAFLKSKLQKAFEPSFVETEKSFKQFFQVF